MQFTSEEINQQITTYKTMLESNVYQHYKGGIYLILDIILDADSDSFKVLYRRIGGPGFNKAVEEYQKYSRSVQEIQMATYDNNGILTKKWVPVDLSSVL
jgi:hypothetical protein